MENPENSRRLLFPFGSPSLLMLYLKDQSRNPSSNWEISLHKIQLCCFSTTVLKSRSFPNAKISWVWSGLSISYWLQMAISRLQLRKSRRNSTHTFYIQCVSLLKVTRSTQNQPVLMYYLARLLGTYQKWEHGKNGSWGSSSWEVKVKATTSVASQFSLSLNSTHSVWKSLKMSHLNFGIFHQFLSY